MELRRNAYDTKSRMDGVIKYTNITERHHQKHYMAQEETWYNS